MTFELIISNAGEALLQSDEVFEDEVTRVEFYLDSHLLVVGFKNPDSEGELITVEIDEALIPALKQISSILVVYMQGTEPVEGFEVPLISLGGL